jgi:hypothetical protein
LLIGVLGGEKAPGKLEIPEALPSGLWVGCQIRERAVIRRDEKQLPRVSL